jgi:hypothetical protein
MKPRRAATAWGRSFPGVEGGGTMARPSRLTPTGRQVILDSLAAGLARSAAAGQVCVHHLTRRRRLSQ